MKKSCIALLTALLLLSSVSCGTISTTDTPASADTTAVQTIETAAAAFDYTPYAGSYMDSVSGRATAEMKVVNGSLHMTVHWADSAFAMTSWDMTLSTNDGGATFVYSDCQTVSHTYDDAGNETTETLGENGSGFFTCENGFFYWTGAEDENCRGCVFEPMLTDGGNAQG